MPEKSQKEIDDEQVLRQLEEMRHAAFESRKEYRKGCEESKMYFTDTFAQPWKLFAK